LDISLLHMGRIRRLLVMIMRLREQALQLLDGPTPLQVTEVQLLETTTLPQEHMAVQLLDTVTLLQETLPQPSDTSTPHLELILQPLDTATLFQLQVLQPLVQTSPTALPTQP